MSTTVNISHQPVICIREGKKGEQPQLLVSGKYEAGEIEICLRKVQKTSGEDN